MKKIIGFGLVLYRLTALLILLHVTSSAGCSQNKSDQSVSLKKSSQTFKASQTFQVKLGDVDADGDLDAVFSNMGNEHCEIWLNDGKGHFTNSGQILTQQAHGVALGDLDGDKDLDLFVSCASLGDVNRMIYNSSHIYFNDGKGQFTDSGQRLDDSNLSGNYTELFDYDGDKDLDAFVVYYKSPDKIYLNDGKGYFKDSDIQYDGDIDILWGDLDGDQDTDAFIKEAKTGYRVLINDGKGRYEPKWSLSDTSARTGFRSNILCDINNDGRTDILITNGEVNAAYPVCFLLNDGKGNFKKDTQDTLKTFKAWLTSGDLNNDSYTDVFLSIVGKPCRVLLNSGKGYFTDSGLSLGENKRHRGCDVGDLDGDGDLDAFVALFEVKDASNEIWLNEFIK